MNTREFPVEVYLARIGLKSLPPPTAEGLKSLVRAQSFSIAFENLDVLADRPIRLDPNDIVEKILSRGRGGYCFELNGLLAQAMEVAGFEFEKVLARVTYRRPTPGPRTHLVFLVSIQGQKWLVDVGFGGPGLVEPILNETDREFFQNDARFRLMIENGELHLQRQVLGEWAGLYRISKEPILPIDIEVVNHFVSTWDRSPFRSIFMCAFPKKNALLTFQGSDLVLLNHELQPIERTPIADGADLREIMRSEFGVAVSEDISLSAWNKVVASLRRP